jgi:hypothetical protein
MTNTKLTHVVILLVALTGGQIAKAAAQNSTPPSPYRANLALHRVYEVAHAKTGTHEVEAIAPVTVQGRVRNVGFVDARFTIRRNKIWKAQIRRDDRETSDAVKPVLLQGRLAVGGAWKRSGLRILPTAASIIGDELKVTFPGRATGSNRSRQRIYTITMKLDGSIVVRARISSVPKSVGRRGACGAATGIGSLAAHAHDAHHSHDHSDVVKPMTAHAEGTPGQLARVLTISTDADQEWYQRYGEQSNAVIAGIINSAEALFHKELGLRFRIVQQHVYADASPYNTTNPSKLLSLFAMNPENASNLSVSPASFHSDVDLKHLFTGKDLDGSVIGIAYIGAVCALPTLSYGITQSYMDIVNPAIFAHELGHNFGAMHDPSSREGLMYPAISIPPAQGFSPVSLAEMNRHFSKYGSCTSLEQVQPLPYQPPSIENDDPSYPDGALITLKQTRVREVGESVIRLSGTLKTLSLEPIQAVGVQLLVAGQEVGRAVTKSNGRFVFFVKLVVPSGKRVPVQVKTEGSDISSAEVLLTGTTLPKNKRKSTRGRWQPA